MLRNTIQALLEEAVGELYHEGKLGEPPLPALRIDPSPRREFGHYSSNIALLLAARTQTTPSRVGGLIKETMEARMPSCKELVEKIEVAPSGFINFFLTSTALVHQLERIIKDPYGGVPQDGKGKNILLEYSQPNTHKEFHIGHV